MVPQLIAIGPRASGPDLSGAAYTCPMHPEVRQPKPGACPKCGMALEPLSVVPPRQKIEYTCPMHPEIIRDKPGTCDICGMNLVPSETLGYFAAKPQEAPLLIPATAPLITGKRAIVYVRVPGENKSTFEGREVVLGPRANDMYIVKEGLHEGEHVVVQGAFKIDSAMQINAKPSMMSPTPSADPHAGHQH